VNNLLLFLDTIEIRSGPVVENFAGP